MIRAIIMAFCLVVASATGAHAFLGFGGKYEQVKADKGVVRVAAASVTDTARFYKYEQDGKTVRFFLVKDGAGKLHAAFDACDVCFREGKGYEQDGPNMRCVNCGMKFNTARVGDVKGGCNPSPLAFTLEGASIAIAADTLMQGARLFPAGK